LNQGYSGSAVRRVGDHVEKRTSDLAFVQDVPRQQDLIALSQRVSFLPRITHIDGDLIVIEFVEGAEGLTERNAFRLGESLRLLHDQNENSYPHPCHTGVDWLIDLANDTLAQSTRSTRISPEIKRHFQDDALIHSEPQFIDTTDGRIVFIDIEGIGRGSRYQDLGFAAYLTRLSGSHDGFASCLRGYTSNQIELDPWRIHLMAGLIAIAYAGFADTEKRLALGLQLMREAQQNLGGDTLKQA